MKAVSRSNSRLGILPEWVPRTGGEVGAKLKGERERLPGEEEEKSRVGAALPCCSTISCQIGHMLCRANIKTVFHPLMKISYMMASVKDTLGLNAPRVYQIPRACGQ